jgi:hypothetical protein
MLVTESIPIWVQEFRRKPKNNSSTTLRNHQFTLEYTSNPSWTAIQSLPYLMEYEHESRNKPLLDFMRMRIRIISSNQKSQVYSKLGDNGN